MYERESRLSVRQQSRLLEHFVAGTTARVAVELVGVQPNTARRFYHRLRQLIAGKLPNYQLSGEIEAGESSLGDVGKGRRGRGAAGKVPIFELLKRGEKVYTAIIPNAGTDTLMDIIEEKVTPDSIVYADCFQAYNALDVSDFHHERINHSKLFADRHNHINGIENPGFRWGRLSVTKPSAICVGLTAYHGSILTGS